MRRLGGVRSTALLVVVLGLGLLVVAGLLPGTYVRLLTRALIFALMAMGLDVAYGHAGLQSLGHAALAGIGGYAAGLAMVNGGQTWFVVGIVIAATTAAAGAAVFALVSLRTRGLYFILVTFALGEMVASLARQWDVLKTSGAEAVVGIRLPELIPGLRLDTTGFLRVTTVTVALGLLVLDRVLQSPLGLSAQGVRDNELRMGALGYNTWAIRFTAFVISGAAAGIAGALFAYHSGVIAPTNVGIATSGLLVLMIIFGGSGTRFGAALGGFLITIVQHVAIEISEPRAALILGGLFVITALGLRGGLVRRFARIRWRSREYRQGGGPRTPATTEDHLVDA